MKQVLVVEDHDDTADMIGYFLEQATMSYQVTTNVASACDWLSKNRPHVILSDYTLPDGTAESIARYRNSNERLLGVGIILMSAHNKSMRLHEKIGAEAGISKPFVAYDLIRLIESMIPKASGIHLIQGITDLPVGARRAPHN